MANSPKKRHRWSASELNQLSASERQAAGLVAPQDLIYAAMHDEVSLDEETWTELEKRIELPLSSDSRAALTRALNNLLVDIAFEKEAPADARKVNQDLKRIDKYAKGLAELIGQHPNYAAQIAVHPVVEYDTSILENILWRISTAARGSEFFKRSGRPRRNPEHTFASRVKEIWQEAAGTKRHGAYWDTEEDELTGEVVHIVKTLHAALPAHIAPYSLPGSSSVPPPASAGINSEPAKRQTRLGAILEALKPRKKKAKPRKKKA